MADKDRVKEGEFRHYVFSRPELLKGIERFLRVVGYELQTPAAVGSAQLDFHAKRRLEKTSYEIVGLLRENIDEVPEAFHLLKAVRAALGKKVDYVLALPPINEYLLLEFLTSDKGKWFFDIKQEEFMLWMHNPDDDTTWCFVGWPLDREFEKHFVLARFPVDAMLHMRLARELLLEEEKEE